MYNPFSLEGKRILVTGASSGIGRSIAIECARMGGSVCLTGRRIDGLEQTWNGMEFRDRHRIIPADLMVKEEIRILVEEIGELDGVVNCAGITKTIPFQFITPADLSEVMEVNFTSPVMMLQRLLTCKKLNKGASVVFISSISGNMISSMGNSIYSASKAAVNGMMKGIALDLAGKHIRMNCVMPGMIDTGFLRNGMITEEQLREDRKRYPLGKRYGTPEEVAYAAIYLLSDASSWTTGTSLLLDGGYTLL